jgi:hypothetical protein
MYGVAGEKSPIFSESDAFLYNLGDPMIRVRNSSHVSCRVDGLDLIRIRKVFPHLVGTPYFNYVLMLDHALKSPSKGF